ncbi:MAG: DedA family protein [Verrucomicrobia bacterium]|nr:DedA family protein [Verrucomicrobiota bacterium]
MELLKKLLDIVLHLNRHLDALVGEYGAWVYAILFLIVFCETGLVVTPFLPGDSLLFAVGAIAAGGKLDVWLVSALLIAAAILGDTVNYGVGKFAGERLQRKFPRLIKPEHLARTHEFFERYGGKTIIIARFVPIVRTFAPFVAGAGRMTYARFMMFNVTGALLWIGLLVPAGYFFGTMPWVKRNFSSVILAIIFISILPGVFEFWRERRRIKSEQQRG